MANPAFPFLFLRMKKQSCYYLIDLGQVFRYISPTFENQILFVLSLKRGFLPFLLLVNPSAFLQCEATSGTPIARSHM